MKTNAALCVVMALCLVQPALGQGSLGGIGGVVRDASGLPIPGVNVTATGLETNVVFSTTTNNVGLYQMAALPVGQYRLSVTARGFKTFVREPLTVATASTLTIDANLEIGQEAQTVEVRGDVVSLDTTTAEVGTAMERKVLLDLPISLGGDASIGASGRRQPENFIFLTPGVTGNQWNKSINGAPRFTAEVVYDGASLTTPQAPGFAGRLSPAYEAVEEFKVQNTLYPVEYGRGFGVLNFTMKSGTNDLHGSLFEYVRNDKFDSRGFFNLVKPIVRQNEFGFTLGGPLVLPKLYNGRDRTFFFGSFAGFELRGGAGSRSRFTMPTTRMRSGDFSEWPFPIFDPATTRIDERGVATRDPFPGNIIPQARFSPITSKLLPDLPPPDLAGVFNNYVSRLREPVSEKIWSIKIDHRLNVANQLAVSFWRSGSSKDRIRLIDGPLDHGWSEVSRGGGLRVNWHYTPSATLQNHFTFGYTPDVPSEREPLIKDRRGNTILGIPNISPEVPGLPTFVFGQADAPMIGDSQFMPTDITTYNMNFVEGVTWLKGAHQFKFGFEYLRLRATWFQGSNQFGTFNFSRLTTSQPSSPSFNVWGNSFASFLLGEVSSAERLVNPLRNVWTEGEYALYAQDKIQITPRLTVTMGLRWDLPRYLEESEHRVSTFDPALPNPAAGGRLGALTLFGEGAGLNGNTGSILGDDYYRAFSPRFALAYRLTDKTVLRTGYGLFHFFPNAGRIVSGMFFQQGFTARLFATSTNNDITSAFNIAQGFPIPESSVVTPNTNPSQSNGGTIDFMNQDSNLTGINQSWTFNIQRELPASTLLDLAYVGSKSNRTWSGLEDINQVHPQFLSLGSVLQTNINSPQAAAAGIRPPFAGFTGSVAQALRPYPQYTVINDLFQPTGYSSYHALQLRLQKRYASGVAFLVGYTLSKTLGAGSEDSFGDNAAGASAGFRALDTYNRHLEKTLLAFDQTHVLTTSVVWSLPFGRGKALGSNWSPVVDKFLGGWQVNAVLRYQSAPAVAVSGGPAILLFGGGNRPNWVSSDVRTSVSMEAFDPAVDRFINASAFGQPAPFTIGNAPRRISNLRGPAFYKEDFSVFKEVTFAESIRLQFRGEFFNLFNRVNFGAPVSNLNNPNTFGQITSQVGDPRLIQFGLRLSF
ncbi:MAG: TonB-dependent receptor [Acidobacteria bacterium]|nr:TonB-dependent receptor [Acidobacteriota bacterium]MCI0719331.1 TonB-dependent receptor [Acidobacteriota bacterium]